MLFDISDIFYIIFVIHFSNDRACGLLYETLKVPNYFNCSKKCFQRRKKHVIVAKSIVFSLRSFRREKNKKIKGLCLRLERPFEMAQTLNPLRITWPTDHHSSTAFYVECTSNEDDNNMIGKQLDTSYRYYSPCYYFS